MMADGTPSSGSRGGTSREIRRAEPLTMYELVFPSDLNPHGAMFGGKVVALMDKCAALCVARWFRRPVVTASIDTIQFIAPIRQGQMIEVASRIAYVGRTSCIVKVSVHGHDLSSGDVFPCCDGYFSVVGTDMHGKPAMLPMIPLETEAERHGWAQAERIRADMLRRREQSREGAGG
jgi:acyl-CoA hydrolase